MKSAIQLCESPIEQMMLMALAFAPWPNNLARAEPVKSYIGAALKNLTGEDGGSATNQRLERLSKSVKITPQAWVARFRVDFLIESRIEYMNHQLVRVVVECDGREFHTDKVKDNKRDREMRAAGYWVMRFTGSEIYKDVGDCAAQVVKCVMSMHAADNKIAS